MRKRIINLFIMGSMFFSSFSPIVISAEENIPIEITQEESNQNTEETQESPGTTEGISEQWPGQEQLVENEEKQGERTEITTSTEENVSTDSSNPLPIEQEAVPEETQEEIPSESENIEPVAVENTEQENELEEIDEEQEQKVEEGLEKDKENLYSYRLLVLASQEQLLPEEITLSQFDGLFLIGYSSEEEMNDAKNYYESIGVSSFIDSYILTSEEEQGDVQIQTGEETNDTSESETATTETENTPQEERTVIEVSEEENTEQKVPEEKTISQDSSCPVDSPVTNNANTDISDNQEETISDKVTAVYTEANNPLQQLSDAVEEENIVYEYAGTYTIALIDTGISDEINTIGNFSVLGNDASDSNGHGTQMARYILEQNPNANILNIKALDERGNGTISSIYAAIEYAIANNVNVINLSMSAVSMPEHELIKMEIQKAVNSGIIVVSSAGNFANNAKYFIPGNIENAIVVGSATEDGQRADFSDFGELVDYYVVSSSTSEAAARMSGIISSFYMSPENFESRKSNIEKNKSVFIIDYDEETLVRPISENGDFEAQADEVGYSYTMSWSSHVSASCSREANTNGTIKFITRLGDTGQPVIQNQSTYCYLKGGYYGIDKYGDQGWGEGELGVSVSGNGTQNVTYSWSGTKRGNGEGSTSCSVTVQAYISGSDVLARITSSNCWLEAGVYADDCDYERTNFTPSLSKGGVMPTMFTNGTDFNNKLNSISGGKANIRAFARASSIPSGVTTINISDTMSTKPIYAWFDSTSGTVYYYASSQAVYLNNNCANMFSGMSSMTGLDLSGINCSKLSESGASTENFFAGCNKLEFITLPSTWRFVSPKNSGLRGISEWWHKESDVVIQTNLGEVDAYALSSISLEAALQAGVSEAAWRSAQNVGTNYRADVPGTAGFESLFNDNPATFAGTWFAGQGEAHYYWKTEGVANINNMIEIHNPDKKFTTYCWAQHRGPNSGRYDRYEIKTEAQMIANLKVYNQAYRPIPSERGKSDQMLRSFITIMYYGDITSNRINWGNLSQQERAWVTMSAVQWCSDSNTAGWWAPGNSYRDQILSKSYDSIPASVRNNLKFYVYLSTHDGGGQQQMSINSIQNQYYGGVKILKEDTKGKPLSGAEFTIYNSSGTAVRTIKSNSEGIAEICKMDAYDGLPLGTYTIKETKAPAGYEKNNDSYTVQINKDRVTTTGIKSGNTSKTNITFVDRTPFKINNGTLKIVKNSKSNSNLRLVGAVFEIRAASDITATREDGSQTTKLYSAGALVDTVTTGQDGIAEAVVPYGNYTIKEITAPGGYKINTSSQNVTVNSADKSITVSNEQKSGPFQIKAKKQISNNYPVKNGAFSYQLFELTGKLDSSGNPELTPYLLNGNPVIVQNDANGDITFPVLRYYTENNSKFKGEINLAIKELVPTDPGYYRYDPHVEYVNGTVTDTGADELNVELIYSVEGSESSSVGLFTNQRVREYLSGYIWHDKNENGKRESGEPIFANQPVKLCRTSASKYGSASSKTNSGLTCYASYTADGIVFKEAKTDSNGYYHFDDVEPGSYFVYPYEINKGWTVTSKNVGSDTSIDSDAVASFKTSTVTTRPIMQEMRVNVTMPVISAFSGLEYHSRYNDFGVYRAYTEMTINKTWDTDGMDDSEDRPKEFPVRILGSDGSKLSGTIKESEGWTYTFKHIPAFDDDNNEMLWYAYEDVPDLYDCDYFDENHTIQFKYANGKGSIGLLNVYTPVFPKHKYVYNLDGIDIDNEIIVNGQTIQYEITVTNPSKSARNFDIEDVIPENSIFVSADTGGKLNGNKVEWKAIPVAGLATKKVTFRVQAIGNKDHYVSVINTAQAWMLRRNGSRVITDKPDPETGITSPDTETRYNYVPPTKAGPEGSIKSVTDVFNVDINTEYVEKDDNLYYHILINNGTPLNKKFTITDKIPENTEFVSVGEYGTFANNKITFVKEIPAKSRQEFTFVVKALKDYSDIINVANVAVDHVNWDTNTVENKTAKIVINKNIANYYESFGKPSFTYKITGSDGQVAYRMIELDNAVNGTAEFTVPRYTKDDVTFTVEEQRNGRYDFKELTTDTQTTTSLNDSVANIKFIMNNRLSNLYYTNIINEWDKNSHADSVTNKVRKK